MDVHTHLDATSFDRDRDQVVARARRCGVDGLVVCASDPARWDATVAIAQAHGAAWTLGVHPWWEVTLSEEAWRDWHMALEQRETPHGIGETGLDRPRAPTAEARARQRQSLVRHLRLARSRGVPVVLHCVRAYGALLDAVAEVGLSEAGGMVHSWSGAPEMVDRAVSLGLHLSFSASVTRSPRVAAAVRRVPGARLLVETDCPDQPMSPGTRGEPSDLLEVARHVAALRGEAPERVLERAADAARDLFPAVAKAS